MAVCHLCGRDVRCPDDAPDIIKSRLVCASCWSLRPGQPRPKKRNRRNNQLSKQSLPFPPNRMDSPGKANRKWLSLREQDQFHCLLMSELCPDGLNAQSSVETIRHYLRS